MRDIYSIPHDQADEVLLWQDNRALIYLRTHPITQNKALLFNFDISRSNGMKQPALAVLMLRFCEQLRKEKIAPETRITETAEPLHVTHHTEKDAPPLIKQTFTIAGENIKTQEISSSNLTALETPGFFTVSQGDETLLRSATYFADTREADFAECTTVESPASTMATAVDRHTRDDHLWRVWACLILVAVLGAWWFTKSGTQLAVTEATAQSS